MRRILILISASALALGACAGPGMVGGGAMLNPEPGAPLVAVTVVAADDDSQVTQSEITVDEGVVAQDETGVAYIQWNDEPIQLAVAAPGFEAAAVTVATYPEETEGAYEVVLEPLVLEGTVVGPDDRALPGTTVELNGRTAVTDAAGDFVLTRALPGTISASRPAWDDATVDWDGSVPTVEVAMVPLDIRGLRVSGDKAADPEVWAHLLELADESVINAFVIDTKDETGWVFRESQVPEVAEIGAFNQPYAYDVEKVIADMDAHGLYKITRVTAFQDNFYAPVNPGLAVRNESTGEVWRNEKGIAWLDASDHGSWEYPLALAMESCELGFDEIQFDYVRFPSDGDITTVVVDGGYNEETRTASIEAFLTEARSRLNPMGCAVAADIFAITMTSDWDEGIGQRPEILSHVADVLSPMMYTYTYGRGWGGIEDPNEVPVQITEMALEAGIPRLEGPAIYRPWIQTWQLNAAEILSVQDVVEERGLGWMIWSANTQYDLSFLPPE